MLFKTLGIVLSHIKYRETSIIVKIYTEAFGIQSYVVNSVRSKNSKPKIALYQPLTLLDLVVYHKESQPIHRISEVKTDIPLATIPFDFKKSCIGIFLTEILVKTLKEENSNPALFTFLHQSILSLDNLTKNYENFHIQFLLGLANFLGFALETAGDLLEQVRKKNIGEERISEILELMLNSNYTMAIPISTTERREILELIIKFYQLNVENFGELKSIEVLKDLMS
jgi:DNA repair protein RecO (recombination protein O)